SDFRLVNTRVQRAMMLRLVLLYLCAAAFTWDSAQGGGGVNPGLGGGFGGDASQSCRRWCCTGQGQAYCCESATNLLLSSSLASALPSVLPAHPPEALPHPDNAPVMEAVVAWTSAASTPACSTTPANLLLVLADAKKMSVIV
ncbi:unnamed protein product, partial [Meganyctiphanes norvegica]